MLGLNLYDNLNDQEKEWVDNVVNFWDSVYSKEDLDYLFDTVLPNVSIGKRESDTGANSFQDYYGSFKNYIAYHLKSTPATPSIIRSHSDSYGYKTAVCALYTFLFMAHLIQSLYDTLGDEQFNKDGLYPVSLKNAGTKYAHARYGTRGANFVFWSKWTKGGSNSYTQALVEFDGNTKYNGISLFSDKHIDSDPNNNIIKVVFNCIVPKRTRTKLVSCIWFNKTNLDAVLTETGRLL